MGGEENTPAQHFSVFAVCDLQAAFGVRISKLCNMTIGLHND